MFGFPVSEKPESLRFANNALQTATFQVRYPSVDLASKQEAIVDAIRSTLPNAKGLLQRTLTLTTQKNSITPLFSNEDAPSGLEFKSEEGDVTFLVRNDAMTLGILGESYTHYANAQEYLEQTFYAVASILEISAFERVAVRKVNIIGSKPEENVERRFDLILRSVFNDDLVGPAISMPSSNFLSTLVTNCRFERNNDNLNLIYGLIPQEFEHGVRQILLDIDIFTTGTTKIEDARAAMLRINNEVFNVFMWALKPQIKNLLQQNL